MVEFETVFFGIPIVFPLKHTVFYTLTGQLIFEFQSQYRNTVDGKHHIHAVVVCFGVVPLTDTLTSVLLILFNEVGVKGGFRSKITDFEFVAAVFETVPQYMDQTEHGHGIFKRFVKTLSGVSVALFFKTRPLLWLSTLNKTDERCQVQSLAGRFSVIVPGISGFLPAAHIGNKKRLNIFFKVFFSIQ